MTVKNHNFQLINLDTDAISIAYKDNRHIPEEERASLLQEINDIMPELITFDDDGYYQTIIVIATKNYVMYDGKKIKIKGSGLKASTKCPALKRMIREVIETICYSTDDSTLHEEIQALYMKYVALAANIKTSEQIKEWSARKTYTEKIDSSERTTEAKVLAALKGSSYVPGDRFFMYFLPDDSLSLSENFDGSYHKGRLMKNIYDTISVFDTVLPVKQLFLNYALKKNLSLVEEL